MILEEPMDTASFDEIRAGKTTDIYFQRTHEILTAKGIHKTVTAEIKTQGLPGGAAWGVLSGVDDALSILEGVPVEVRSMSEGTVFHAGEPVMSITGDYAAFGRLETAVLGLLCQASGIATKAARCKRAAGERLVISFGARRMHPAMTPVIERSAYIGGCDGVSAVLSAEKLGIPPSGTMPHALILIMGDVVRALLAFDEVIDPTVRRVALVDTFCDEKMEAVRAAEALGERLWAVRLDTPASRRGDFARIIQEVRWELDLRGFQHVKIIVSGGIDEQRILELNPLVDGYGVGTSISNADVVDFAMDIVDIEGQPIAKRGKESGVKQVMRCAECLDSIVVPVGREDEARTCGCGSRRDPLLVCRLRDGRRLGEPDSPQAIRSRVLEQIMRLDLESGT